MNQDVGDDSDSDEVIDVHSDDEVMQQALVSMFCSKSISTICFSFTQIQALHS